MKKKIQNDKRSKTPPDPSGDRQEREQQVPQQEQEPRASVVHDARDLTAAADLEFDRDLLRQIQLQTSLIEGRKVSREETLRMLNRIVRQHSLAAERRLDYVVRFLKEKEENPP